MTRVSTVTRKVTSIRIDGELWADFKGWCKKHRTSTCHVIEPLIYALMKGLNDAPAFSPLPKVEMTLNISREVLRARRREHVGPGPVIQDWGDHLRCHVCRRTPKWMVNYSAGWDKLFRVWLCGYHVPRYRRMVSYDRGWPRVRIVRIL